MLGFRTKSLNDELLNLHNFSLESERTSSYSLSWRAGTREDTVREVCDGSHRIQTSPRGIAREFYVSHRTHQLKDTVLYNKKTRICLVTVLSNGSGRRKACQASAQDKVKQQLHLVRRPGQRTRGRRPLVGGRLKKIAQEEQVSISESFGYGVSWRFCHCVSWRLCHCLSGRLCHSVSGVCAIVTLRVWTIVTLGV